jgi:hypothetical protein
MAAPHIIRIEGTLEPISIHQLLEKLEIFSIEALNV